MSFNQLVMSEKEKLLGSVACPVLHAVRAAEHREIDTLDKVYTRLMLGSKAERDARKLRKRAKA